MADDSRKLFYSIGEVAAVFHVNESTLRFWEKEFPTVIKTKKNAKGTRNYTKEDIESIRLIYFLLKEKGMTLAGARKKLLEEKKGMSAQHELTDRLKKIKSELLKLQTELGQPAQEAPEFAEEATISKRMVFAEPGSEMIYVESLREENPPTEFVMEEIPVPDEEHLPAPEPILEDSPFDFSEEETVSVEVEGAEFTYELEDPEPHMEAEPTEESTEFDAEKFTAKPAETVVDNGGVEQLSEPKDKTEAEQPSEPMEEPEVEQPSEPMEEPEVDDPSEPIEEPVEEQSDDAAARALYEELEPELIYQPKPEPESEPTPEQNLFYEQPEPIEPTEPEPSKDGWSGSLF